MAGNLTSTALRSARIGLQSSTRNVTGRRMGSSSTVPESVRNNQEKFLAANDKPVFIKGGPLDAVLYRFTMGCCVLSLGLIAMNLYKFANKK